MLTYYAVPPHTGRCAWSEVSAHNACCHEKHCVIGSACALCIDAHSCCLLSELFFHRSVRALYKNAIVLCGGLRRASARVKAQMRFYVATNGNMAWRIGDADGDAGAALRKKGALPRTGTATAHVDQSSVMSVVPRDKTAMAVPVGSSYTKTARIACGTHILVARAAGGKSQHAGWPWRRKQAEPPQSVGA